MRFGIFSNGQRHMPDVDRSWAEDLHEVIVADRAGLSEAWISEHGGSHFLPDGMPSPEMMIAKASGMTERIHFGSGVRRIALYPPVQVAIEAVVCERLTAGRYTFGFGVGGPVAGFEQRGLDSADSKAMTSEAIQLILRCWSEAEPFSFRGAFYQGDDIDAYPKPRNGRQVPTAVATTRDPGLKQAAELGFRVLTSQWTRAETIRDIGDRFDGFMRAQGRADARAQMTACRGMFVADTDERAFAEVEETYREHLAYNLRWFAPVVREFVRPGESLEDVTFERLVEEGGIFVGSARTVADRIRAFHAASGGFGTMLAVTGKNWGSREQRECSLDLLANTVAPRLADLEAEPPPRSAPIRAAHG